MSWNAQNRQSTTGANNHALPLAILGLIGVYAAYVLVGVLTNRAVCGALDATVEHLNGQPVIVLRVPAASRKDRPVYINGNPYTGTFVRRHGGDYACSKQEVDRMMRDASDVAFSTTFGSARLTQMKVWADETDTENTLDIEPAPRIF